MKKFLGVFVGVFCSTSSIFSQQNENLVGDRTFIATLYSAVACRTAPRTTQMRLVFLRTDTTKLKQDTIQLMAPDTMVYEPGNMYEVRFNLYTPNKRKVRGMICNEYLGMKLYKRRTKLPVVAQTD